MPPHLLSERIVYNDRPLVSVFTVIPGTCVTLDVSQVRCGDLTAYDELRLLLLSSLLLTRGPSFVLVFFSIASELVTQGSSYL